MLTNLKLLARDALPARYQVPIKYWREILLARVEPELELLEHIGLCGSTVVDVGANRGLYAYHMARLQASVHAVEPNPQCFRIVSEWSTYQRNVTAHNCALSDHEGQAALNVPVDDLGVEHDASASLEGANFGQSRQELVRLRTLDSLGLVDVRFIKIDVEGHEASVIEGATATLARDKPALLIEIEQRHHGKPISLVFERITRLGYLGFFLEKKWLLGINGFDVSLHQSLDNFTNRKGPYINNFLFLHAAQIEAGNYLGLFRSYPRR